MTSIENLHLPSRSCDESPNRLRVVGGAPNPKALTIGAAIPLGNQLAAIVLDLENFKNGEFMLPGILVKLMEVVNSHDERLRQLYLSPGCNALLTGKYTGSGSQLNAFGVTQYEW